MCFSIALYADSFVIRLIDFLIVFILYAFLIV